MCGGAWRAVAEEEGGSLASAEDPAESRLVRGLGLRVRRLGPVELLAYLPRPRLELARLQQVGLRLAELQQLRARHAAPVQRLGTVGLQRERPGACLDRALPAWRGRPQSP